MMEKRMTKYIPAFSAVITMVLLFSSSASSSDKDQKDFVCEQANNVRFISVEYLDPPNAVPCRVLYEKPQEKSIQYPWSAKNQAGYCEEKAKFLAEKLSGLGVICNETEDKSDLEKSDT